MGVTLVAACSHEEQTWLHGDGAIVASSEVDLSDSFPAQAPPFSEGIFPCSRCHLGGPADTDELPTLAHAAHLAKGLECDDCHFEDEDQADPTLPTFAVCEQCHDDLAADSDRARAYFDATRQDDGSYRFPKRWATRDVEAAHETHWNEDVECESCHGTPGDGPFTKPRAVPLMDRCVACHTEAEAPLECAPCHRETTENAHTFALDHAEDQRGCLDCHDRDDRDTLRLANGDPVPFTESYRLCGQCHGPRLRDWRLGLHGKRTGMWNGRREYLLCAHCHNPHQPRIEPAVPLPPPQNPEDFK